MAEPTKVFLSYAREDEVEVERLYGRLLEDGLKPWMSGRDILPGEDWERSITKAVRGADFFLVCLTSRSLAKRGFLQKEIKQALEIWKEKLEDDIYLIPLRLELCQVPVLELEFADLFLPGADYLKKLSEYCIADLHRQIARERGLNESEYRDDNWIMEGAGPKHHNFDAWLLAKTGLLIIFDPYRVSSYAGGTREVNIGVEALKDLLRKDILSVLRSPE
jgi:hypothetical protein